MARSVTVEGSLTPCEYLPRGVRRTVELDDTVRRRIERGYYLLVGGSLDDIDDEQELTPDADGDDADASADPDQSVGEEAVPEVPAEVDPPAGNASKEEWLDFLRGRRIDIPTNAAGETPGRDGLKAIWRKAVTDGVG